ncbi:MAG: spermidine/putrescine ABC transporter substrate-binding protein [Actinomycetota bacterium]
MRPGRWFAACALAAAMALVLPACGGGDDSGDDGGDQTPAPEVTGEIGGKLVISNWDAYLPEDLIPNFEKETGVDVELAVHTTNEDIMGKLQAQNGSGFDLVFVSGPFVQALQQQGWASALDHDLIPNAANLYPEAAELGYDVGNRYSMPYTWGTTGLCYRTDLVDGEQTDYAVFHDPPASLEKKMTMLSTDRWLLQPALLSLGYSINTTDPAEIEEATQWTIEAKENLLGFDDTTFYSKLVSGEASLVQAWDGWCNYGIAEDPNIEFTVPEQGSDVFTDAMVVMESSENKASAHAFIDYVLDEANGKAVAELVLYKVPNRPAMEALSPKLLKQYPNMAIPPAELLAQEPEEDLGTEGTQLWSEAVAKIKAA